MSDFFLIGDGNFEVEVIQSALPVLLEFGAPWCGPCKMLEPVLVKLGQKWSGKIRLSKVDVDESPDLTARFGVMGVPTVILFKDGKEMARITGYMPLDKLEAKFGPLMG